MTDTTGINSQPMYRFLMVLTISSTMDLQAWRALSDNFAIRVVGLDGGHVGVIQWVREIPGVPALLIVLVMLVFKEHPLRLTESSRLNGHDVCRDHTGRR